MQDTLTKSLILEEPTGVCGQVHDRVRLHLGDCLEEMFYFTNCKIDMVLADLPYGTTKAKWDIPINLSVMWWHFDRLLRDNVPIVLFSQQPFTSKLIASNPDMFRYEWIWEKTQATGFLNANKMPLKAHENILVFYKKLPAYYPQKTTGHKPINSYTKYVATQNNTELYGETKTEISGGGETDRFPRTVQVFSSDKQKTKLNGTIHSTQKPVELLKYLINTYTNDGDTVLDITMGSGSTGVACVETDRNFIGIEKYKEPYELAKKRIYAV